MKNSKIEVLKILIEKTGKAISSITPVILNSLDLGEIANKPTGEVYVGELSITDNAELIFSLLGVTTLSVNKTAVYTSAKIYDNLMFDEINGPITEDTEILFSGYKIILV